MIVFDPSRGSLSRLYSLPVSCPGRFSLQPRNTLRDPVPTEQIGKFLFEGRGSWPLTFVSTGSNFGRPDQRTGAGFPLGSPFSTKFMKALLVVTNISKNPQRLV